MIRTSGYLCDLCKAYAPNIKKKDEREMLSKMWKKYYDLDYKVEQIYCEGCRCTKADAKLIDVNCPVRKCVIQKQIDHCGECKDFPCKTFFERRGLTSNEAKEKLGEDFISEEYENYLLAYDNMTRMNKGRK